MVSRNQRRQNKNQGDQKTTPHPQPRNSSVTDNPNTERDATQASEQERGNTGEHKCEGCSSKSPDEKPFWKRPSLTDWIMMAATAVIAVATAWNAIYVGGQLYEMKVDQRPYVSLSGNIEPPHIVQNKNQQWQVLWNWQFINFGKGVAYKTTMHCFVKIGTGKFRDACGPSGIFVQEFPPNIARLATAVLPPAIDNIEFSRLLGVDGAFQMRVDFQYFSESKDEYVSSICVSHLANGLFMFPDAAKCKD